MRGFELLFWMILTLDFDLVLVFWWFVCSLMDLAFLFGFKVACLLLTFGAFACGRCLFVVCMLGVSWCLFTVDCGYFV